MELYRSIDEMPLVNLPSLSEDQLKNIEESMGQTQSQAETLRSDIADFRSGTADKIDKVESAANKLGETIQRGRDRVAQVTSRMAKLEAFSIRMQHDIPIIVMIISVILSVILAYVIWTQVEIIRQYAAKWRLLGQGEETVIVPVETPTQPVEKPCQLRPRPCPLASLPSLANLPSQPMLQNLPRL